MIADSVSLHKSQSVVTSFQKARGSAPRKALISRVCGQMGTECQKQMVLEQRRLVLAQGLPMYLA